MTTTPRPARVGWDELERRLTARPQRRVRLTSFRESAVLVTLIDAEPPGPRSGLPVDAALAEPELLYIVRTTSLPTHAGQVAFPGGKREAHDATLIDTALREAAEEVGIAPESVRVLGTLDDVATPMGFVITPVVGVVRGPLELCLQEGEVAQTFTAAVSGLPATYRSGGQADWQGHRYTMHEFHHGGHRIWGATAAITIQLLDLLSLLTAPPRDPEAIR
jgi:8-oxo-dGTP pyrophosphatase MutT (NUDIX family)